MPRLPKRSSETIAAITIRASLRPISKRNSSNGLVRFALTLLYVSLFSARRIHAKDPPAAHNDSLYIIVAIKLTAQDTHNLRAGRDDEQLKNIFWKNILRITLKPSGNEQNGQDGAIALWRKTSRRSTTHTAGGVSKLEQNGRHDELLPQQLPTDMEPTLRSHRPRRFPPGFPPYRSLHFLHPTSHR